MGYHEVGIEMIIVLLAPIVGDLLGYGLEDGGHGAVEIIAGLLSVLWGPLGLVFPFDHDDRIGQQVDHRFEGGTAAFLNFEAIAYALKLLPLGGFVLELHEEGCSDERRE